MQPLQQADSSSSPAPSLSTDRGSALVFPKGDLTVSTTTEIHQLSNVVSRRNEFPSGRPSANKADPLLQDLKNFTGKILKHRSIEKTNKSSTSETAGKSNQSNLVIIEPESPNMLRIVETRSLRDEPQEDPNEDWCAVCHDGGELVCCESCPRVFHEKCHIPSPTTKSNEDWVCVMCKDVQTCPIPKDIKRKNPLSLECRDILICERILMELYCHEVSTPFHEPVSKDVPLYYETITKPMDLSVIKSKLCSQAYEEPDEFVDDVNLIFKNCYKFNEEDSGVFKAAQQLEKFFNELLSKYYPLLVKIGPSSEPQRKRTEDAQDDSDSGSASKRARKF